MPGASVRDYKAVEVEPTQVRQTADLSQPLVRNARVDQAQRLQLTTVGDACRAGVVHGRCTETQRLKPGKLQRLWCHLLPDEVQFLQLRQGRQCPGRVLRELH